MFAAIRTTAVVSLGTVLSASMLTADATAQTRGSMPTAQASRPTALRNSFAPSRPNVSSLSTSAGRTAFLPLGAIPLVPAAGAPAGDGGSQGGSGSQGGGSEAQPAQGGGQQPVQYVSPYDLAQDSKRDTALASLRAYGGGLNWPIGLRTLEPEDAMKDLRKQVDGVVEAILRQPAAEPASADIVQAGVRGIERIARHFERVAYDLPLSRTQEKETRLFYRNVYAALKALEPAPVQAEVKTAK